jgi:hypothetical protein
MKYTLRTKNVSTFVLSKVGLEITHDKGLVKVVETNFKVAFNDFHYLIFAVPLFKDEL